MLDSKKQWKKVMISGGGTGGHIHPALAIADEIRRRYPTCEIQFVGSKDRMEMEKVPAAGYPIEGLWITGIDRNWKSFRNWIFPLKLLSSIWKARKLIRTFQPQLVIGVGGFASGPLLFVAAKKNIPTAIQEQNSFPGITNRLLAKQVKLICAGFPGLDRWFPAERIKETGNPLREQVIQAVEKSNRKEALDHFDFKGERPVVFIMGGSLGAGSINEAVKKLIQNANGSLPFDLLWQCGSRYFQSMQSFMQQLPARQASQVRCLGFIDHMDLAYQAADIITSRAGAMSIAELALVGKPTILVPSPNVAEDHQTKNARSLSDRGGALILSDQSVSDELGNTLISLLNDPNRCAELSENLKAAAKPDAVKDVVNELEKLL
ncbi:MAG: undecaprenyldiphospho-muramoylpentapeptide beta-N-acetylglucosaminyltransferase [Bacteroidetes bacterium]|nr:undecaprenyldiphospho-muramoylpentapeptide beta-N-acetylglucosaminyltransferase [Bacteroidota bacterium]